MLAGQQKDFLHKLHIPEQFAVHFYNHINTYTPAIGYFIFSVEDDILFNGIDSFDNTCVSRISSAGLLHVWYKVCDGHSGTLVQMIGQEPQLPIQPFFFCI